MRHVRARSTIHERDPSSAQRSDQMTEHPEPSETSPVSTDLVEYLIIGAPGVADLTAIGAGLAELVDRDTVRLLDLAVVRVDDDGAVSVVDPESQGLSRLAGIAAEPGYRLLNDHDIELASRALRPGTTGVVVVVEDRWAAPLSAAARSAGGQIVAGDRIPSRRVEAALAHPSEDGPEGG